MITYKLCSEVNDEDVYKVFIEGYSDYYHKVEMDMPTFVKRFLENEAAREFSYIAFDDDKAIGIVLGNIRIYQGVKTMRCGGFNLIPSYRNKGIGSELFKQHMALAKEMECKQLYLEALKVNTKAIKLYERLGYQAVYDYRLYKLENINFTSKLEGDIREVSFDVTKKMRYSMPELHMFWQGEMFTIEKFDGISNYVIYEGSEEVAVLSIRDSGLINFIWVQDDRRQQGLAKKLLCHALEELNLNKLMAVAGNNFVFEGFLRNLEFKLDLEQVEMMLPVKEV